MRATVLINADAGTSRSLPDQEILRTVRERFLAHGWTVHVSLISSGALDVMLATAVKSPAEALIVGGGDGTVSRAIRSIVGTGKTFGVLPLGTFNLLGHDLGMPTQLDEAIESLCRADTRVVDLAVLNDRPFHSLSGLGYFARVARERERVRRSLRLPRWIAVAVSIARAIFKPGMVRLEIEAGGTLRGVEAAALLVTNNRFARDDWRRARLDEGILEVHVLGRCTLLVRLKAALDVVRGRWRDNAAIETFAARSVVVRSRRPRLWVSTDGELERESTPLRYGVMRSALRLLVPPGDPKPDAGGQDARLGAS